MNEMKKVVFVLIILFSINSIYAQKHKKGILIVADELNKVNQTNVIYYYGWDLSNAKLTDGKLISRPEELSQKVGGILGLLSERFNATAMERYLKKEVIIDLDIVQKEIKDVDYDNFVTFNSYELSKDEIAQIVRAYQMTDNEGVGLVMIGENLNKSDRYATAYITFFDVKSKELIWVTKMKGLPGSKWGFSKYWYEGLLECPHYFFSKYYKS